MPLRPSFAWNRVAPLALALALGAGCGPSLRRVEQANEYFERCHAADRDEARADDERRACWQAWRDHYATGQPHDRVDYVRERLVVLDPRNTDAMALAMVDEHALEEVPAAGEVTPAPPEGPELSDSLRSAAPARARRRPVAPRTRTSACGAECEPAFVDCAGACEIADRGCTDACRHVFRQCARGCY